MTTPFPPGSPCRCCADRHPPPPPVHDRSQAHVHRPPRHRGAHQLQHRRLAHQGRLLLGGRTHSEPGLLRWRLGLCSVRTAPAWHGALLALPDLTLAFPPSPYRCTPLKLPAWARDQPCCHIGSSGYSNARLRPGCSPTAAPLSSSRPLQSSTRPMLPSCPPRHSSTAATGLLPTPSSELPWSAGRPVVCLDLCRVRNAGLAAGGLPAFSRRLRIYSGSHSSLCSGCQGGDRPIYAIRWSLGPATWKLPTLASYSYTATTNNCNSIKMTLSSKGIINYA